MQYKCINIRLACLAILLSSVMAGAAPAVKLSPTSINFNSIGINPNPAETASVTLTNTGTTALTIRNITVSGVAAFTSIPPKYTCPISPATLAAGANCSITVSFTPLATGVKAGTLSVADNATGSPQKVTLSGTGLAVALTSISVTPATATVAQGWTEQYAATGTYNNNTTEALTSVTWTSSVSSVATISSTGLATGVAPGNTSIQAASGTIKSSPTNTLTVTAPPTLTSITVTPATATIATGSNQQYVATGNYSNGSTKDLTATSAWTSSVPSVATITSTGFASVVGTTASSSTTISAVSSGVTGLATLTEGGNVSCSVHPLDAKVLVVAIDGTEVELPAVEQILGYVGVPYTVVLSETQSLPTLSDNACHGYYEGVILTQGGTIYTMGSSATTLEAYEKAFSVRQVNWYTYPTADFGFSTTAITSNNGSPTTASFTAAGTTVFPYVNTANPLTIQNAWAYLTTAATGATPLLTDSAGHALAVVYTTTFASDYLTLTFDSNPNLTHDLVLAYGLVNWVTKGIFLGQYHVYAEAQADDFFIDDSEWVPGTPCSDPITNDRTPPDASSLPVFRINSTDMAALDDWQGNVRSDPLLSNFRLTLAFNGVGTAGNQDWTGKLTTDDLTANVGNYEYDFYWISHTYDHPTTLNGLHKSDVGGDIYNNPKTDDIDLEVLTNMYVANETGQNLDKDASDKLAPLYITNFDPTAMVTPGVTGLNDPNVPIYLYQDGIRYVVTDTSMTPAACAKLGVSCANNGPNPSPNVGIVNSYEPGIYEVPRHPNDVFYNTANWNDDQAEFYCIYQDPTSPNYSSFFATYTTTQVQDYISTSFVNNMLMGDMDPEMFHQPNLHAYDGVHSLLSDIYDQTFAKYEALYKLPVLSLTLAQLGQAMQARNQYNNSGVTATVTPGNSITITATAAAVIPVTGLNSTGAEVYGGQYISHVSLAAGQSVTLPLK